jgi:hypothetical protein
LEEIFIGGLIGEKAVHGVVLLKRETAGMAYSVQKKV